MRTIYKIENQSYCNLHETLLSDSANNDMIVSTAVAMRKKCRTTGGFVQTLFLCSGHWSISNFTDFFTSSNMKQYGGSFASTGVA